MEKQKIIKLSVSILIIGIIILGGLKININIGSYTSLNHSFKTLNSDITGRLNRKATVYDYNGNKLATYEGKFDIAESDNGKIIFDSNGKRVQIYNALVIVEEN